jgi:hypothetical protein
VGDGGTALTSELFKMLTEQIQQVRNEVKDLNMKIYKLEMRVVSIYAVIIAATSIISIFGKPLVEMWLKK